MIARKIYDNGINVRISWDARAIGLGNELNGFVRRRTLSASGPLQTQFSRKSAPLIPWRRALANRLRDSHYVLGTLLALHCLVFPAAAHYRFDSWTTDNGLPENSVLALLQTRDGYLWMTTKGGLVRFDGMRFRWFTRENKI